MLTPRKSITPFLTVVMLFCACFLALSQMKQARAQENQLIAHGDKERGVELLQQKKIDEAIKALRLATKKNKTDAEAWNFLGTALIKKKDVKSARKAFETALKLRPDYAAAHYNLAYVLMLADKSSEALKAARRAIELDASIAEAHYILGMVYLRESSGERALAEADATINLKPSFAPAFLLKSQALMNIYGTWALQESDVPSGKRAQPLDEATSAARIQESKKRGALLRQAADSLEQYLKLAPAEAASETLREQLEALRIHGRSAEIENESERTVFNSKEVSSRARILTRPEPEYTDEARSANVSGIVILHAIFATDGKVKNILVISSLPHGLTEAAMRAARSIKFTPAMKDGRPVSQFIQIEYRFNLF